MKNSLTFWRECFARVTSNRPVSRRVFVSGKLKRTFKNRLTQYEVLEPRAMLSATALATTLTAPGVELAETAPIKFVDSGETTSTAARPEAPGLSAFKPVFEQLTPIDFSGESGDYQFHPHSDQLELEEGTVSLRFTADDVSGQHALFSKDASGTEVGGHLTAFVVNDRLKVRLQSTNESVWLETAAGSIEAGQEYHLAVTFGEDGFWIYLDGVMADWNTEFTQTLETNNEDLAIGASIWGRSDQNPDWANAFFDGTISDFQIYDTQFDRGQVTELSGYEAAPILESPAVIDGALVGTLNDDGNLDAGSHGVHMVFGDYGDDVLIGNSSAPLSELSWGDLNLDGIANVLNGGHGNDRLVGSDLNDVLISRADGREPVIAQEWDASDDPDNELDPISNTYYAGQPIEGDDVLVGGGGADLFYFQTLINAKEHIILKHVNSDGTIEWGTNGVAGENDNVHDHWVERLGHELIEDFSREEGDHILIEGHTTEAYELEYVDSDGDGIMDSTVIHIWSNQANGGAHDEDLLGTITVADALLTSADYTVNKVDHGIVRSIAELDEAIEPYEWTEDDGIGTAIPAVNDGDRTKGEVLHIPGAIELFGKNDEYVQIEHHSGLELANGSISFTFIAEDVNGSNALFSKDHSGTEVGGHMSAFVNDGRVKVRFQSTTEQRWLSSEVDSVKAGEEYHVEITFGEAGFHLYLDGELVGSRTNFTQGLDTNNEQLAIGANIWGRSDQDPLYAKNEFAGRISDFTIARHGSTEVLSRVQSSEVLERDAFFAAEDSSDELKKSRLQLARAAGKIRTLLTLS